MSKQSEEFLKKWLKRTKELRQKASKKNTSQEQIKGWWKIRKKQKICVFVGLLLLTICFLFPPWYYEDVIAGVEQTIFSSGNSFILKPPPPPYGGIIGVIYESQNNAKPYNSSYDLKQSFQLAQDLDKDGFWNQHFIDEPHIYLSELIFRVSFICVIATFAIFCFSNKYSS